MVDVFLNKRCSGPIHSGENFQKAIDSGLIDPEKLSSSTAMKRLGTIEEIGKVVAFLLSDDASYISGGKLIILAACNDSSLLTHWQLIFRSMVVPALYSWRKCRCVWKVRL